MRLLYLVFGNTIQNHFQANFSILSFLRKNSHFLTGITVITDAPDLYQHLASIVTVQAIPAATLQEWQGKFKFFWRVKIKALEYTAQQYAGEHIIYLDTDTFLHGSLSYLSQELANGVAFMHEVEGALSSLASKTERRMWQQVKDRSFGGITMHKQLSMWNAGVVGIPASQNMAAIKLALSICDELCEQQVTPRLIEQFALSVALHETYPLHEARPYIGHYWSTKAEWNSVISTFFLESHLRNRTADEEVAALTKFDYRQMPIKKKVRSTQARLNSLVSMVFPPKQIEFISPKA
ncbi:hypothetical protein [Hymenobacter sp. BRD67]|uniref:hypothetical protein n=1 Tax=Hymenobacter sp. BRD67 TaxID=2675877 RepID=UPI0015657550|nr:hypothetical protein [Hymenobacter sp. BRD67]QKG52207.1 hypothetical protein GKZ67_05755 [Hymenobacter sp. BRD67]